MRPSVETEYPAQWRRLDRRSGRPRHAVDTDRVLATLLFTDIVGSTEQSAVLGHEALVRGR